MEGLEAPFPGLGQHHSPWGTRAGARAQVRARVHIEEQPELRPIKKKRETIQVHGILRSKINLN